MQELELQQSFRDNTSLYTKLYQEGKHVPKDRILILQNEFKHDINNEPKELPSSPEQKLLEEAMERPDKLLLNLSVPQIACLFLVFREMGIINENVNTELAKFIKATFSSKNSADISLNTMGDQLSNVDSTAVTHWLDSVKDFRLALTTLRK